MQHANQLGSTGKHMSSRHEDVVSGTKEENNNTSVVKTNGSKIGDTTSTTSSQRKVSYVEALS